ncbi:MAG TPA: DNA polymerase III subunit gamma/tau [Bacteroidia bacterium]|nr:DNA polymerase III subunit gamma/tau [Bacteroidia bacterium]
MENFVVSARKYRPAHFNTVVGQSSITTTLKNAIRNNQLAHSFLFCGPRGVGKTTCARILAKTINCTNITPDIEACEQCENCRSFNSGQTLNIYELDAASNNGVDDIRNLTDQVRIPPQMGKYKVYIIDEVHMLSAGAFNAFLKTLEEPPSYAIFILATTERHKILPTILSRCQVFSFHRILVEDIANQLDFIAKSEGVEAEQDALHVIAQKADGAMRDALSMFDQVVSFAGKKVTYKAVIDNLNVLDYDYYFRLTDHLLEENIPSALLLFNEVLANGFDGHNFISGVAAHFRNLLVCKDPQTLQLLEMGQNIRERYREQSEKCSQLFLLRALGLVNKCDVAYKNARNQRLQVEFTLMQLTALNAPVIAGEKKNDGLNPVFGIKSGAPSTLAATQTIPVVPANPQPEILQRPADVPPATIEKQQPVAFVEEEKVVLVLEKKQPLKTGVSISSFITRTEEKKTEVVIENNAILSGSFTQEKLESAWLKYAETVRSKRQETDYHSLTMNMPVRLSENKVSFTVYNKMAEERLNSTKTELMGFLRNELQNSVFTLEFILSKEEGAQKIYTSADKFRRLAEINPALTKLKQQFDLDIDF